MYNNYGHSTHGPKKVFCFPFLMMQLQSPQTHVSPYLCWTKTLRRQQSKSEYVSTFTKMVENEFQRELKTNIKKKKK